MIFLELVKVIIQSLIALGIAVVAHRQWRLAKLTLAEKLFDRRMQVYSKVASEISNLNALGKTTAETSNNLADAWRTSHFLFGKEVSNYINEIRAEVQDIEFYQSLIESEAHKETRPENIDRQAEKKKWLSKQSDPLFEAFLPYLTLTDYQ
ncbi:hypothetical protein [Pseudoruegeria sp. SHC-113]|uniref:hypothetical protein n=1 Tax=Pseudoruegeria sp. SHC-113 TaxID=2855439 RepID=UPI0021BB8605|nr:hypothetical protein [Pseudoruegeria sp. SHC-113]MCT8160965.1 hypothetical protein [Pseudoruegeria sp. SHC-113]